MGPGMELHKSNMVLKPFLGEISGRSDISNRNFAFVYVDSMRGWGGISASDSVLRSAPISSIQNIYFRVLGRKRTYGIQSSCSSEQI